MNLYICQLRLSLRGWFEGLGKEFSTGRGEKHWQDFDILMILAPLPHSDTTLVGAPRRAAHAGSGRQDI